MVTGEPTPTPVANDGDSGINVGVILGPIAGVIIVGGGLYFLLKTRAGAAGSGDVGE